MPENSYSFKPNDDVRSFGELVTHIAKVQQAVCENINGKGPRNVIPPPTSKENRVKALEDSSEECLEAFAALSAQNANKMVKAPNGDMTHLAALVFIITHATEEYGQMSIYLRLKHLVPPTTDDVWQGDNETLAAFSEDHAFGWRTGRLPCHISSLCSSQTSSAVSRCSTPCTGSKGANLFDLP